MGLLDCLAEKMRCEYLSDLRQIPRPSIMLRCALAELILTDFSEWEWIDAADYLCGVKCNSAEEARNMLIHL